MIRYQHLNYRIVGNGYPVLFLHGFLESSSMWNALLPSFEKYFQCILIDLPGHGNSPSITEETATIPSFAHSVKQTLNELSIDSYSIVGHSLGGYVGLALIDSLTSFNGKLVLLNSHPWPDSSTKKEERSRVIEVVHKNKRLFINSAIPNLFMSPDHHQDFIQALIKESSEMKSRDIRLTLEAMKNRDGQEALMKRINNRTKVIQGKHDHMIPYQNMEVFTRENKIDFELISNAGHMSHVESKNKIEELIVNYLT